MAKGTTNTTARKPRDKAPEGETPSQKFVRVGQPKVNKALRSIAALTSLAGKGFDFTTEQRDKITTALVGKVDAVKAALTNRSAAKQDEFKL